MISSKCPHCKGRGYVETAIGAFWDQPPKERRCETCDGYGVITKRFLRKMQTAQKLASASLRAIQYFRSLEQR